MALMPHWLDEVFSDPSKAQDAFRDHPRVKAAFEAAEQAYRDQKDAAANVPGLMGPSPSQAARRTFIEELGLPVSIP